MTTKKNYNLPKEFIELNQLVTDFNCGQNVRLFGENKYLLIQGSKVKGYSLFVMIGNITNGCIYKSLNFGLNKKGFMQAMDTLNNLAFMFNSVK